MILLLLSFYMLRAQAETINVEGSGQYSIQLSLPNNKFKKIMKKIGGEDDVFDSIDVASTTVFGPKPIVINYWGGASGDPQFIFLPDEKSVTNKLDRELGRIFALKVEINDDAEIFTSGHTNNMFSGVRKFLIKNGKINEIKQPFIYAGIKSKALMNVDARATTSKDSEIVFKIRKGVEYEIVLSDIDENNFLVKENHGLVGWVSIEKTQTPTVFKDIFYFGD